MILRGAAEHIADIMTISPSLSSIPSASSILDTSNYTFQAISYGKDPSSFRHHAHTILSPSGTKVIKVVSYGGATVSSYNSSTTFSALSHLYNFLPCDINPDDTRLERGPTYTNVSASITDIGQCMNAAIHSSLSSFYHLVGCFPPSSGVQFWITNSSANPSGNIIYSGTLSGAYNRLGIMDTSGFLTFRSGNLTSAMGVTDGYSGAVRLTIAEWPKRLTISWLLPSGDAGALCLFGGIYHIGLWVLDVKAMLRSGYSPPFAFNPLNNIRKYKLFAKQTFSKDLLYVNDALGLSGFKTPFVDGTGLTGGALFYQWALYFY